MTEQLDGLALTLAGRRRWSMMQAFYGEVEKSSEAQEQATVDTESLHRIEQEEFRTLESNLHIWRIKRFSGRQKKKVPLEGMLGELIIRGPWNLAGDWLSAVHLTHLGKYASFGLGRVRWEPV